MESHECPATKKCKRCGVVKPLSEFYSSQKTRTCKECQRIRMRGYYQQVKETKLAKCAEYRAANKPKIKRYLAEWYERRKEHVSARCHEYNQRPEVKERERERHRVRYATKRNEIIARRAEFYRQNPDRIERNKERLKKHYYDNKPVYTAKVAKRRAQQLQATPKWADQKAITKIYRGAARLSAETGILHAVDHVVPLQGRNVCGLHVEYNLRVIPAKDNHRKSNKHDG